MTVNNIIVTMNRAMLTILCKVHITFKLIKIDAIYYPVFAPTPKYNAHFKRGEK